MIAPFLVALCLKSNSIACENASIAYYKQTGIEANVTKKSKEVAKKHPKLATLVSLTSMLVYNKFITNIGNNYYVIIEPNKNTIGIKTDF